MHHWLLTTAGRGYGGQRRGLDASQPQKAAGDSTVPIVRFHYIPSVFVFLSLCLCFSVRLSCFPSNQVLPRLPHFPSKRVVSKKAFLLRSISVWLQSRMCGRPLTPNPMWRSDVRKRHTERDERRNKEQEVGIKRNKRQAGTEEMSLSVRERHEWAGALIIDRMIKADEEGFFPQ